jgi:hypothetical protein
VIREPQQGEIGRRMPDDLERSAAPAAGEELDLHLPRFEPLHAVGGRQYEAGMAVGGARAGTPRATQVEHGADREQGFVWCHALTVGPRSAQRRRRPELAAPARPCPPVAAASGRCR